MADNEIVKSSGQSSGELIPQPHGGALKPGAGGGKQPGAGRPPSWFRQEARRLLAEQTDINGKRRARIEFAAAVLDGEFAEASVKDRLKAWAELMKIGVPTQQEVSGPDGDPVAVEMTVRFVKPDVG